MHRINKTYKPAGVYGFLSFFLLIGKVISNNRDPRRVKKTDSINRFVHMKYVSSVKNKSKFREVHDASRDNIMCGLVCMKCRMHGRYTTWLSGASYMFSDSVM